METAIIQQVARHLLQACAGFLIAKGHLDTEASEMIIGAGTSIIAFGWWWFAVKKHHKDKAEAEEQETK